MNTSRMSSHLFAALLGILLCGCSPFYVLRAAYEEGRILAKRQKIEKVIEDPVTPQAEREKLLLVPRARTFAETIGLTPGGSFTKFSRIGRDVLAWVLMASRPDSFELYTWWFPVTGSLPYKGYFDKPDAEAAGRSFESRGYEIYMRPTDAFSTLGWFDDPLLSTTLRHDETRLVEIIIHESLHSTIWVGDAVDFNESLANYVGTRATVDFFSQLSTDSPDDASRQKAQALLERARQGLQSEAALEKIVNSLYDELSLLYLSGEARESKLEKRKTIFETHVSRLREKNPRMQIFKEVNNAEIMQLKVYLTGFSQFDRLFEKNSASWNEFLHELRSIKEAVDSGPERDPWKVLAGRLG